MKCLHLLLIVLVGTTPLLAAETGLYDISNASHPKPLRDKIGQVTLSSESNDNRQYYLQLRAASSFSLPCNQVAFIVGNRQIRFNSQGMSGGGYSSMETIIDDPGVIPQVAQYFRARIIKRRHPGHQMLVEFLTDNTKLSAGKPVMVRLRLTNLGDTPFAFIQGGRQRGPRDNQFAFSAELVGNGMMPDTGDPRNMGGIGVPVTLSSGKSHEIEVDLVNWFTFKKAGSYNIRGTYHMNFIDPKAEDLYTIWEDYACAEFTVRIGS